MNVQTLLFNSVRGQQGWEPRRTPVGQAAVSPSWPQAPAAKPQEGMDVLQAPTVFFQIVKGQIITSMGSWYNQL